MVPASRLQAANHVALRFPVADDGGAVSTSYVLLTGAAAQERLRLLAEVHWPATAAFLDRLALETGARCLDVGCGAGAVTLELARRVGPGHALGLDRDVDALARARGEAARRNVPASFGEGDAQSLTFDAAFDLVYARCLLSHLVSPGDVLQSMVRAARPGGTVAVEDIDFSGCFCEPPSPAFDRYVDLYESVVRGRGADPRLGRRLFVLAQDAGLVDVELEVVAPVFHDGARKRLICLTLDHIRDAAADLAPAVELDALAADLQALAANPRTLMAMPRVFQVRGRRAF